MIIGLVGRTNVGKSTLFNRLLGSFRAIVTDISGTTRELLREELADGKHTLVDSPGLERFKDEQVFIQQIIEESDLLFFVVDGKEELGEQDLEIKDMIIKSGKKAHTVLVVNKLDSKVYGTEADILMADYYTLGFDQVVGISAQQSEGIEQVREVIRERGKTIEESRGNAEMQQRDNATTQKVNANGVAIVGRPNVGKSTLLNTLVGEEIAWVQDKPGTTLDYIKAQFVYKGDEFTLYDTAGIRKKGKVVGLERIAYDKTMKMIEYVRPVVVMMLDAEEGVTHRDKTLIAEIVEAGVGVVVAVNKADLFEPKEMDWKIQTIRDKLGFDRVPVVKISGKESFGLPALLDTVMKVRKGMMQRISTPMLNKVLKKAWMTTPPRFPKNKICKWKYVSQVDTNPPKFLLSVNNEEYANFSFKKWIENVVRKEFGFSGVPLQLKFSSKVKENPYLDEH